ncbi:HNH endonuclease signature motif containing protein [Vagococcus carniphilus]|uniref:HNH endonuclease signature motif containing protein n=1 Tax=Vagococcus carniphilus TaxID=218144 RepID=UPI0028917064|nr:HNH endonuclease signature motif containing protein [Vagococcus carniphilus]MDT2848789.1 HNH endonuclease signature motif containing protein [Vagococcus carniphilus]
MEKLFSDVQAQFILKNYKGIKNEQLTKLINKEFGTSYSINQVMGYKSRNKLNSGLTGEFKKGNVPYNKGIKRGSFGEMSKTQFKKGQKSLSKRKVWTERILADGYTQIKVANPSKWMMKHKFLYEKHFRKVKKNEVVIFLNGDKTDFSLDNLEAVTRGELARLNKFGYIQSDPEITKTGINIFRLADQIKNRGDSG